jgi:hypothetical protein
VLIVAFLNSNRIIAGLTGNSSAGITMTQIDARHVAAFSTKVPDGSVRFQLASLHGFWGEQLGRFANTFLYNPDRKILFSLLFILIMLGVYMSYGLQEKRVRSYCIRLLVV